MGLTGTDSYGPFTDTGTNTAVAARAYTEEEIHFSTETDSGSKNTVIQTVASHVPHRAKNSPR